MDAELFKGKTVLIMGLGRFGGGVDATEFACGAGAKVIVTDLASAQQLSDSIKKLEKFPDIEFHLGSHEASDFKKADVIIVNPAVTPDNEFLGIARQHNKLVTSQINIFFELCPASIIGITGANGKSTTTALTAHLLKNTRDGGRGTRDEHIWLSGNIGDQPLLMVLDQISPDDLVVLEISSFQLEQLAQIQKAPKVSLLTNLMPNHLDRYGTFASYCAIKENIFKFQKPDVGSPAVSIFNAEDKISAEWFERYKNDAGRICIKFSADDVSEEIRNAFPLPGRANLSNLAAAVAVARNFGVDDDRIISCLPDFKALPHRLELIGEIRGVRWYNDSKATTPESAIVALEAFELALGGKIIIAGGYDKNLPFEQLGEKIAKNAKAAILIGQTAQKIAKAIEEHKGKSAQGHKVRPVSIEFADSLAKAVQSANHLAESGDVVLLSPACASYDMFENFQHRGREFCRLVRGLDARL